MEDKIESYLATAKELLKARNKDLAYDVLSSSKCDYWVSWSDNLNFRYVGYYQFDLQCPLKLFVEVKDNGQLDFVTNAISEAISDAARCDGEFQVSGVELAASTEVDSSPIIANRELPFWEDGFYRVFISHAHEQEKIANNLSQALRYYGITAFVAKNDIDPGDAWRDVIEKSLFTSDALVAILTPQFYHSQWCQQEVGFGLGRNIFCLPLKKNEISNPSGIFGKCQALDVIGDTDSKIVAKKIYDSFSSNEKTSKEYSMQIVKLLLQSSDKEEAIHWGKLLPDFKNAGTTSIRFLYDNYDKNEILQCNDVLELSNQIFTSYGFALKKSQQTINENDLPF